MHYALCKMLVKWYVSVCDCTALTSDAFVIS